MSTWIGHGFAVRSECTPVSLQGKPVIRDFYFKELSSDQIGKQHQRNGGWVRLVRNFGCDF